MNWFESDECVWFDMMNWNDNDNLIDFVGLLNWCIFHIIFYLLDWEWIWWMILCDIWEYGFEFLESIPSILIVYMFIYDEDSIVFISLDFFLKLKW